MAYYKDPTGRWMWVPEGTPGAVASIPAGEGSIATKAVDPANATFPNTGTTPGTTPTPPATPLTPNQLAWQSANNALKARRQQIFDVYGLNEQGHIDPNNIYGTVRQTLSNYGRQLELAKLSAESRGLGGQGLGNQAGRLIRYMLGAQSAAQGRQFLSGVADVDRSISAMGSMPTT